MQQGERETERQDDPVREPYLRRAIDEGVEQLLAELRLGRSDRLERYLAFSARFHRYSLANQLLIFQQCPQATRVAGYRTWRQLGYQVAKGQKGIRILAPRTYTRTQPATGEEEIVTYFVQVAVFDASQLAGLEERPLPAFFTPLPDEHGALFERLARVVTAAGVSIAESPTTGQAQGFNQPGRIVLKAGLDSTTKVLTLLHEYAHELLHWNAEGLRQPMRVKECHAEAVSFVVAHHFGLQNPFSADYLQSWGNTAQDLRAELGVVHRTAATILDQLEQAPKTSC